MPLPAARRSPLAGTLQRTDDAQQLTVIQPVQILKNPACRSGQNPHRIPRQMRSLKNLLARPPRLT